VSLGALEFTLAEDVGARAGSTPRRSKGRKQRETPVRGVVAEPALVAELKKWRLSEAKRAGVPAFRVLHDRTLLALAAARPRDETTLLAVPGIGPALLARYGRQVLGICRARS
jgi:superfamily II DNA helicase RecQ